MISKISEWLKLNALLVLIGLLARARIIKSVYNQFPPDLFPIESIPTRSIPTHLIPNRSIATRSLFLFLEKMKIESYYIIKHIKVCKQKVITQNKYENLP